MRGYRRRGPAAYLLAVAASFLLVTQLGGDLLQLPARPWWGLIAREDGTIRRVFADSPAARAGIVKGERIEAFAGAPSYRPWEQTLLPDGRAVLELRSASGELRAVTLEAAPTPRAEVLRRVLLAFTSLSFLFIGLVVFLSRSDLTATLFFSICFFLSWIMMSPPQSGPAEWVLLRKLGSDLAFLFLSPVFLHFFLLFPRRARLLERHPHLLWVVYAPALISIPFLVKFDVELVLLRMPPAGAALAFQTLTGLVFVGIFIAGLISFHAGVKRITSPLLRRSVRWVLPGTALGILPPILYGAVLQVVSSVEIPGERYVFLTLILVPLSFAHGILRYGLMDLELVLRRSVVYTGLTALLVAVYYLVSDLLGTWVADVTGTGQRVLSFACVFAAALLFVPLRERVQGFVDRKFHGSRYDYRGIVQEFSSAFATLLERKDVVRLLTQRLPEVLGTERAALFVRTSSVTCLHLAGTRGIGDQEIPLPSFQPSRRLLAWWREFGGPVPVDRRRPPDPFTHLPPDERNLFTVLEPDVIVFLQREREVEGLLALGRRTDADRYSAQDLELLMTLGNQAGTALSSARFHEEALERRRLEEELAVARRIQASLLPSETPRRPGLEIAAFTRPSQHVGGDFYDFLDFGPQGLGLAVADVSGKGVPAALILSSLQATLRAEASRHDSLEPVVGKINRRLCGDVQPGSFASLLYGLLNADERTFRYVNAGHPAGLIVRRDGAIERLEAGGILLGVEPSADYETGLARFETGDLMLLYSDGVTDVLNEADEEFGLPRLETLLGGLRNLPAKSVLDTVVSAVETFVGGSLPDDLTLLAARFVPHEPAQETAT
jgi:sigma-B regulation protein RsbU (phosphoserine phosphatase)